MPPKKAVAERRHERKDPTEELKELAKNESLSDEATHEQLKFLIDEGAAVDAETNADENDEELPVIYHFVAQGKALCTQHLIFHGAALYKEVEGRNSLLQHLVTTEKISQPEMISVLRVLVVSGVCVEKPNYSTHPSPLALACNRNLPLVVKELLRCKRKPYLETGVKWYGKCLAIAAANGHETIVRELIKAGAKLESPRDVDGATPLLVAAEYGQQEMVKFLLEAGANKDATTNHGSTALHCAARNGHADVCKLLIENGLDGNARTLLGGTCLDLAVSGRHFDAILALKGFSLCTFSQLFHPSNLDVLKFLIGNEIMTVFFTKDFRFAVNLNNSEAVKLMLEHENESLLTVSVAQELISSSGNKQIETLLQKWIDKKNGIVELKIEDVGTNENNKKKGGRKKKM